MAGEYYQNDPIYNWMKGATSSAGSWINKQVHQAFTPTKGTFAPTPEPQPTPGVQAPTQPAPAEGVGLKSVPPTPVTQSPVVPTAPPSVHQVGVNPAHAQADKPQAREIPPAPNGSTSWMDPGFAAMIPPRQREAPSPLPTGVAPGQMADRMAYNAWHSQRPMSDTEADHLDAYRGAQQKDDEANVLAHGIPAGPNVPARFQVGVQGSPADPVRARLAQQAVNPGASYEQGVAVHRGNLDGPTAGEQADARGAQATQQLGVYDQAKAHAGYFDAMGKSATDSSDPKKAVAMGEAFAKNPDALRATISLRGGDPGATPFFMPQPEAAPSPVPTPPQPGIAVPPATPGPGASSATPKPGIHLGNVDQALASPQLAGAARYLNNADMPWDEVTSNVSHMQGFENPGSPVRQAYDAALVRKFPTAAEHQKFVEGFPAISPDQWGNPGLAGQAYAALGSPGKETLGGPAMATAKTLLPGLFPSIPTHTGWNWRRNHERGQTYRNLMDAYKIAYPSPG